MRDEYKLFIATILFYSIGIICFTTIAILLNKWWLSLFNILILRAIKVNLNTDTKEQKEE